MNKRQKLVQQQYLDNEQAVIKRLEYIYDRALFEINDKIRNLEFAIGDLTEEYDWMDADDPARAQIKSKIQSKIYQKQYQQALKDQVEGVLNRMQTEQFVTVSAYLDQCYEDGFIGNVFDLHGQGIPLLMPLDQTKMVRAIQLESKISKGLYRRLGEDVALLKKRIAAHVTRSIATGATFAQMAKQLAGQTRIGYNNAVRIARTEGHRIQTTATMDVMGLAKDNGADVVKQWDAALDKRTRKSHQHVDGEIRELDEPFSNGLMFPGDPDGRASEVINCRCALLQRARWALDADELETLKKRAKFYGLDKSYNFKDFKKKYLKVVGNDSTPKVKKPHPDAKIQNIGGVDCWVHNVDSYGFTDGTRGGVKKTAPAVVYTTPDGTQFIYPKKYNKQNQTLTPDMAIEVWNRVPENIRTKIQKTVEVVDYYNPRDSYWKKVYKNFGHSYATGGEQITMYRSSYHDLDYLLHTFCHEGGHYIDYTLPGTSLSDRYCQQSAWQNAMAKDLATSGKKSWRAYGENSPLEDFADSVGYYATDRDKFAAIFPERTKLLDEILK